MVHYACSCVSVRSGGTRLFQPPFTRARLSTLVHVAFTRARMLSSRNYFQVNPWSDAIAYRECDYAFDVIVVCVACKSDFAIHPFKNLIL